MRYDLDAIRDLCREIGLSGKLVTEEHIEIDLGGGAVLYFQNADREEDCLMGFLDVPWHTHDDILFADAQGNSIEFDYLDLLVGLKEGQVLVCEIQKEARVVDRSLIHSKYNDEFRYLEEGAQVIVRRATASRPENNRA